MLIRKIDVYNSAHRASPTLHICPHFFPHPLFQAEHSLREFALNVLQGSWELNLCVSFRRVLGLLRTFSFCDEISFY